MAGGEIAGLPQRQFMQPLQKIVALAAVEPAAQRIGRGAIGAGRAAEAEIDAARKQRLQHLEALGDHERRVVGQHHAAGADADVLRHGGDLADHQIGRGACDGRQVVMLGEPVPDIAEPIDMAGQVDAVAQRRGRLGACGDDGKVENGKRNHGDKLVREAQATKAHVSQIWAASEGLGRSHPTTDSGKDRDKLVDMIIGPHPGIA